MQTAQITDSTTKQETSQEARFKKRLMQLAFYTEAVDRSGAAIGKPNLASEFATAIVCFISSINDEGCLDLLKRMCGE